MKLYEACDIGYCLGLNTIGECIDNVIIHQTNLFNYDDILDEMKELNEEFAASGLKLNSSAVEVIGNNRAAAIDKEIENIFENEILTEEFFEDMDVDGSFVDDDDLPF